ncbi:oligosaccharide flippase family protein [Arthrobacter nitrophenolicus]|uniref:O-antigen/teichoic acid export membrane protein n=2 Tax=Arthrobacter nitrophenolicus TaxID=683150 RepID=A0ACC6TDI1_9MICC|nr:oligosaccharide flippase family protein [Arthrobacter nitrophenolicus]ELT45963.1 surface polysaccharide flippase [Arthrobacter nitrophenolicus]
MGRKKLASQFAWVSAGRLIGALIQAVTMLLLARDLGPYEFGLFSAVFGTIIVFQSALDLGIATMVVKERAADPQSPVIHSALRVADHSSFALAAVIAFPLAALGTFLDPFFMLLLPLSVWAAAERHSETWLSVPLADGDARINTQNLLIRRTAAALLYLGAVFAGIHAAVAFSAAMALTALISLIVIRKVVSSRLTPPLSALGLREIVRISWPFWMNSLGTQARNLDTLLVSAFAGPTQAGFYAATSRATGPLRIFSTSMAAVLLPASAGKERKHLRKLFKLVWAMGAFCGLLYGTLMLLVPAVVHLFLGDAYRGAVLPLQIVLAGLVFAALSSLFNSILQGAGLQYFVAKTSVITTGACLILVSIGSLFLGAIGAAFALSFSFVLQSAILASRVSKFARRPPARHRLSAPTGM